MVLTAGSLVLALITGCWIFADTALAPPTDSAHHLFNAISFARTLRLGGIAELWSDARGFYVGWPPATYALLHGPLGWLLGDQTSMIRLGTLALAPLLLWGTFRLGTSLTGDRKSGTLAALLVVLCLGVAGQLRQVSIDLPATATVLLAMVALFHSRGFCRARGTLLFGAAVGLCLLTRVQAAFFLTGPVAVATAWCLVRAPSWRVRAQRLGWLSAALVVALLISSPWWFGRLDTLWYVSTSHLDGAGRIAPRGDPSFTAGLAHYCAALGKLGGWTMLAAALGTLPLLLLYRWRERGRAGPTPSLRDVAVLLAWIVGGVVGCSLGIHREPRYLLPAIPALALLAVVGLRALPRHRDLVAAALALTVIGPTLVFAAFPVGKHHWLTTRGVLEWAYVRHPGQPRWVRAAREAATALVRDNKQDRRGEQSYLLFVQDARINYVPRMGSYLVSMFPQMAFSSQMSPRLANSAWHRKLRRQRRVYLLSEVDTELDLPLIWMARRHAYMNRTPVRLYRVPPTHKLLMKINRHTIFRWAGKKRGKRRRKTGK